MKVRKEIKQYIECDLAITGATLLSIEEAEKLPLSLRIHPNWWWLRSPGYLSRSAAIVSSVGSVYDCGFDVNDSDDAVRPALQISNLNSSNLQIGDKFVFGEKEFEIISDSFAFCVTDIGRYCFREDGKAEDANDYESSDVKKYVDDWFVSSSEDCNKNTSGFVKLSEFSEYVCSNCGKSPKMIFGILPDYCPWCGKKMIK